MNHPTSPSDAADPSAKTSAKTHDTQAGQSAWELRGFRGFRGCISLRDRIDRQAQARAQFRQMGWSDDDVTFHLATRHSTDSEQGIYESHQACLRLGLASGAAYLIVFEDDVQLKHQDKQGWSRVAHFLEAAADDDQPTDWDVLFLGCFATRYRPTGWPGIFRIRYQSTAHAYIVTADMARRLVDTPWQGHAWDDQMRDWPDLRCLAVYPSLAFQSNAVSDNRKTPGIDRMRRLLGGMARLQRLNEWMFRHFRLLTAGHGLVAALVVLAVILWRVWR